MQRNNQLFGLIWGGVIGDAFGSRYEFMESDKVKEKLVQDKFQEKLLGGGPFKLKPGQVTDDSELALALANGLKSNNGKYDQKCIVKKYLNWMKSKPFDIGMTIKNAFEEANTLEDVINNTTMNAESKSNGCMMRIWPIVYFYHDRTLEELSKCVAQDCVLTHPNKECIELCVLYCTMLHMAVNGRTKQEILNELIKNVKSPIIKSIYDGITSGCIKINNSDIQLNGNKYIGYIGISLAIVLREFIKTTGDMKKFMSNISSYGGDTDTDGVFLL